LHLFSIQPDPTLKPTPRPVAPPPPVPAPTPGFPPPGGVCGDINNQASCNGNDRDSGDCVWMRDPPGRANYCATRSALSCADIGRDQCNSVETFGRCAWNGFISSCTDFFSCGAYTPAGSSACNGDDRCAWIIPPTGPFVQEYCADLSSVACGGISVGQCSSFASIGCFVCQSQSRCAGGKNDPTQPSWCA